MLKNSKNQIISKNTKICSNIFSMGTGLMFRNQESIKDTAWIFDFGKKRKVSVTMMFVSFPIDILLLDEKKKVIEQVKDVKPWGYHDFKKKGNYMIELKKGIISEKKIKIGDTLKF